jgi:putative intracellular protease/amidase
MADNSERPATQRIGILVFDGFEPIDVFGFAEAFTIARFLGQGYASKLPYPFETVLMAKQVAKEEQQRALGHAGMRLRAGTQGAA